MLACTEIITMCLQSAKQKHLHPKRKQAQGWAIFEDIFHRADKNDDGKLSFDEFNSYFADGVISTAEMQQLFYAIDKNHNNNLDTAKLSGYFSLHLGKYMNVLSALQDLNDAILAAMDKTKQEYQSLPPLGQFVTRFMLRETTSQLHSLQVSLQWARDALDKQSSPTRKDVAKSNDLFTLWSTQGYDWRLEKLMSTSNSHLKIVPAAVNVELDSQWDTKIHRLQQLIDKLECQGPKLEPVKYSMLDGSSGADVLLVQRQVSVIEKDLENFQKRLKRYADATIYQSANLLVCVQKQRDKSCFAIYELWQDQPAWESYVQSRVCKAFQRSIIEMLAVPEVVSTMLLPASWWIINNSSQ